MPCKVNTSVLLEFQEAAEGILNSCNTLAALYIYLTFLLFKTYTIGGSKLTQACNKVHVYSTVVVDCRRMALCVHNLASLVTFGR